MRELVIAGAAVLVGITLSFAASAKEASKQEQIESIEERVSALEDSLVPTLVVSDSNETIVGRVVGIEDEVVSDRLEIFSVFVALQARRAVVESSESRLIGATIVFDDARCNGNALGVLAPTGGNMLLLAGVAGGGPGAPGSFEIYVPDTSRPPVLVTGFGFKLGNGCSGPAEPIEVLVFPIQEVFNLELAPPYRILLSP